MEPFKRENFERAHPGTPFPVTESVPKDEAARVQAALAVRLGASPTTQAEEVLRLIMEEATPIQEVSASSAEFSLEAILRRFDVPLPDHVLVNWRHFDDMDRVRFGDLASHFDDFWYPDSDDIEVIDPSCTWVIAISHEGYISWLRFF